MMDNKGENMYRVTIQHSPVIQFSIHNVTTVIFRGTANSVTEAKRNARKHLASLGVIFKKEIKFKKHEKLRKKIYQQTRRT